MGSGRAEVYIIESPNEDDDREGEVIYRTLKMAGKDPVYRFIRTVNELQHFVDDFEDSEYRYLHLSCHGSRRGIATTLDHISIAAFAEIVGPALDNRRLFLSTCLASTMEMATAVFAAGGATSVVGPTNEIHFDDSVILWSSFYHLMFKTNFRRMKRIDIKENLAKAALLVGERVSFFHPRSVTDRRARSLSLPARSPGPLV